MAHSRQERAHDDVGGPADGDVGGPGAGGAKGYQKVDVSLRNPELKVGGEVGYQYGGGSTILLISPGRA